MAQEVTFWEFNFMYDHGGLSEKNANFDFENKKTKKQKKQKKRIRTHFFSTEIYF